MVVFGTPFWRALHLERDVLNAKGASGNDTVLGRAAEYPGRRDVNDEPDGAYTQHQFTVDMVRFVEAVECPVHHPGSDQPECERVQHARISRR